MVINEVVSRVRGDKKGVWQLEPEIMRVQKNHIIFFDF